MKYKLKFHRSYDYLNAQDYEWYSLWQLWFRIFGREVWTPVRGQSPYGNVSAKGDRSWARRISQRFGIPMPANAPKKDF